MHKHTDSSHFVASLATLISVVVIAVVYGLLSTSITAAKPFPHYTALTASLPPRRPTPTIEVWPTSQTESENGPGGAHIELHLHLPMERSAAWQEIWTVVQWKDNQGNWHDVKGWQGSLKSIVVDEGEHNITGYKTWWVSRNDLGTGPFRWVIYKNQHSKIEAISKPFNLPQTTGTLQKTEVMLK